MLLLGPCGGPRHERGGRGVGTARRSGRVGAVVCQGCARAAQSILARGPSTVSVSSGRWVAWNRVPRTCSVPINRRSKARAMRLQAPGLGLHVRRSESRSKTPHAGVTPGIVRDALRPVGLQDSAER